jgi:hypothetical protein
MLRIHLFSFFFLADFFNHNNAQTEKMMLPLHNIGSSLC